MQAGLSIWASSADKRSVPSKPRGQRSTGKRLDIRRPPPSADVEQLDERKGSHQRASFSGSKPDTDSSLSPATELIFRLDRRGVGWGEEILPHLTVEQRVLKRNRSAQPDPWTVRIQAALLLVEVLCPGCSLPICGRIYCTQSCFLRPILHNTALTS